MKKHSLGITVLAVAGLALAACAPATPTAPAAPGGAGAALPTSTAAVLVPTDTPTAAIILPTDTPLAATGATQTPTAAAAAPAGTETTTPAAANINTSNFVAFSAMLNATVQSPSAENIGSVAGAVVQLPKVPVPAVNGAPTPQATPNNSGMVVQQAPLVRYLAVNPSVQGNTSNANGNEVLVPWSEFAFNQANGAQTITLNLAASALANAPHFTQDQLTNGQPIDYTQTLQYWSSQGINVPVTGVTTPESGNLVFIPSNFNQINVTDTKNNVIGPISDLLISPSTGEITYAVFNGGQLLGNKFYVVPVSYLTFLLEQNTAKGIQITIPTEKLNAAPAFQSLQQIPLNQSLNQYLNSFYNNFIATPTP